MSDFFECLRKAREGTEEWERANGAMIAFALLMQQEVRIIHLEWSGNDSVKERAAYAGMRTGLEAMPEALYVIDSGRPPSLWHEVYDRFRANHNLTARGDLDGSDGRALCFVLPVFHTDGSHELWGGRDVPWRTQGR